MGHFSELLDQLQGQKASKTVAAIKLNNFVVSTMMLISDDIKHTGGLLEAGVFDTHNESCCQSTYISIKFPRHIFEHPRKFVLMLEADLGGYTVALNSRKAEGSFETPERASEAFFDLLGDALEKTRE